MAKVAAYGASHLRLPRSSCLFALDFESEQQHHPAIHGAGGSIRTSSAWRAGLPAGRVLSDGVNRRGEPKGAGTLGFRRAANTDRSRICAALRRHIAERISRETGRTFTIDNVLLTVGAMQGLDLLGKSADRSGRSHRAQFPTYSRCARRLAVHGFLVYERAGLVDGARGPASTCCEAQNSSTPSRTIPTRPARLVPTAARRILLEKAAGGRRLAGRGRSVPAAAMRRRSRRGRAFFSLGAAAWTPMAPMTEPVIYLGTLSKASCPAYASAGRSLGADDQAAGAGQAILRHREFDAPPGRSRWNCWRAGREEAACSRDRRPLS